MLTYLAAGGKITGLLCTASYQPNGEPEQSASESEKREDGPAFYAVTSFLLVKNEVQGKLWTLNPSN